MARARAAAGSARWDISAVSLALFLFIFWLVLSGHYTPVLVTVGAAAAVVCTLAARRMRIADPEGHPIQLLRGALTYWPWLAWEIVKSAWGVTRLVLHPRLPISPTMTVVKAGQRTAAGITTYANSITLTPGTITVGVSGDLLTVHALVRDGALDLEAGGMDARVSQFEGASVMFVAAAAAILVALALVITRAIKGPTVFDRVLAGNSVGTLAILLLAVFGFLTGRPEFLDIGLTYGLLNLIGTLAVLKFFRHGDLAYDVEEESGQ